jgi:hypothetical protein
MRIKRGFLIALFSAGLFLLPTVISSATIKVSWLPDTNSDMGGYMVYSGTKPGAYTNVYDAGGSTTFLLTGAQSGVTYYVAVAAYDLSGNFSPMSDEKSVTVPIATTTTPVTPTGISLRYPSMGSLVYANPVFSWSVSGFSTYRVFLSTNGRKYSRIYTGTGTSCSMQQSLWDLFVPSGTKLSWYVQGYSATGKWVQSSVMQFVKG